MTKQEFIEKIVEVYRKATPGFCQVSGEKLVEANTSDGVHGFEIRVVHPDMPGRSVKVEVCKKVYLDWYKVAYPEAPAPKI